MKVDEILARLADPGVAADRLLDQVRGPQADVWREHPRLYPAFVERLLAQGHPGRALELAREGARHLPDDSRLRYLLARAAANGGSTRYAEALLEPLLAKAVGRPAGRPADLDDALWVDVVALRGRLLKDRSAREPGLAAEAARWYERAAAGAGAADPAFPLINAATMWRAAGDRARSDELAAAVLERVGDARAEAAAAAGDLWPAATRGEACLLLGRHEEAVRWYLLAVETATRRGEVGRLLSVRANIRRLQAAGATADPAFLDAHLGRVVVFSGHLLDSPDRMADPAAAARFPPHPPLLAAVAAALRERLDRLNATVGYCSLGCGSDILFAEAMLARGGQLHVVLPFGLEDFRRTSVTFGQNAAEWQGWGKRFGDILETVKQQPGSSVRYITEEPYLGSRDLFRMANAVLQGLAVLRGRERTTEPTAVAVLDPGAAGQPGGTADFLAAWTAAGHPAEVIDLAALRAAHPAPPVRMPPPDRPPVTSALPRPVKAMLFADVAGFSAIPEWQLPEFLTAYGAYLRALFGSAAGRAAVYANTWGDGLYAVFDRVADAAAFAVALVEPAGDLPVPDWAAFRLGPTNPLRVGLHAGPVFELRDLFQGRPGFAGQHVNRAARIEPVTVRGCAYASEPFAALLTVQAADRFAVEGVGVHSLAKDYDRCPLYRVQRAAGPPPEFAGA